MPTIAGRIGGQRLRTDYQAPEMPRAGHGALTPNVTANRRGARAAGVLTPGSPGFDQLNQSVQDIFGRTTDLPIDSPFSDYLISVGYGDANPGAFPERNLRRDLRRGSLEAAAGAFNSGPIAAPGGGGGYGAGGGYGGNAGPMAPPMPGGGGGGGVDTSRLRNLQRPTIGSVKTPERIAAGPLPGRVGPADMGRFKAPDSIAFPDRGDDGLDDLFKKFLSQRVGTRG